MPRVTLKPTNKTCEFGKSEEKALGAATIRFPADDCGDCCEFDCFVVPADVPMLLGKNENRKSKLDFSASAEEPKTEQWSVPAHCSGRHWRCCWPEGDFLLDQSEVLSRTHARAELSNLHKKFGHPEATKPCNLAKKAQKGPTADDLAMLKQIGRERSACQHFARSPMRHMATISDDVGFNHEIAIVTLWANILFVLSF